MNSSVLLRFFKSRKLSYIIGFAFMFAASFIQTLFPKVLGSAVDLMKNNGFEPGQVLTQVFWMVLIAAIIFLCTFLWRNIIIANGRNLECYIREELYRHFLKLSPGFFQQPQDRRPDRLCHQRHFSGAHDLRSGYGDVF